MTRVVPEAEAPPPLEEARQGALSRETAAASAWALTSGRARAEELPEVLPSLQHGPMSLGEGCLPLCPDCS